MEIAQVAKKNYYTSVTAGSTSSASKESKKKNETNKVT
jgi:hypothetical protein